MSAFTLDPDVTYLNHGSFGACPKAVQDAQAELRARLEAEPVRFFLRERPRLLDAARETLAEFLGARAQDLVFVRNATEGVNAVLRSLRFSPGDELLATRHGYNACNNALRYVAEQSGAQAVFADVPFPLERNEQVLEAVLAKVTPRTRLALLDHVTSPTGLVFPVEALVKALGERGVPCLVDGAHAPGMVPLRLSGLGAAFYTGNLHKWVCAPKGAAFLWVREDLQPLVRPLSISHGANAEVPGRSRYWLEFDWTGTDDPSAPLCVPAALQAVAALEPGGWPEVQQKNRALALEARAVLCRALGAAPPAPADMVGSLAAVPLPLPRDGAFGGAPPAPHGIDPLQDALWARHRIEVPIYPFPAPPARVVRVSAQHYNRLEQYHRLAAALVEALGLPA